MIKTVLELKDVPHIDWYEKCAYCGSDLERKYVNEQYLFVDKCINPECGKCTNGMSCSNHLRQVYFEEFNKGNHKNAVKHK